MPDISMCADEGCPLRATCYRNPASGTRPSEWLQAWADFKHDPETGECASYWPTKDPDDD